MTKNMGTADRAIRTVLALVVAGLYFTGRIGGIVGIVLLVIAVLFLLTSLMGWCPGYLPFRISTRARPPGGGAAAQKP
jgi:hypothetical protein